MSKEPFPAIRDEIRQGPKRKLDLSLKPRNVPDDAIEEGARAIGEKWGSVSSMPARRPAPPPSAAEPMGFDRSKWPSVRFECPPYLDRELTVTAAQRGHTKTYLILRLLSDAGFTVHPDDLVEDKRKLRKKD
jgi:hypothetical protein